MVNGKAWASQLGRMALSLLGISFITFALVMLSPGDPVRQMLTGNEDVIVSELELATLRAELGLDRPFLVQYLHWLMDALKGDFGFSYMAQRPVVEQMVKAFPATIALALSSTLMMLVVSLPLGIYCAVRRGGLVDYLIRGSTFAGIAIPNFWMGLMVLWLFGLKLRWFSIVGGTVTLKNLVLPSLTLAVVMAAKYTRQVRGAVLEELNQDYVTGARARGMSEAYILWREVLPNAMLPLVTLLGLSIGNLLGGAAVVEMVFSWPGLGQLAVQALIYRDFQLVQAVVLWMALAYMVINRFVDLSYSWMDPRLRKAGR